jgi:hypothetical protein
MVESIRLKKSVNVLTIARRTKMTEDELFWENFWEQVDARTRELVFKEDKTWEEAKAISYAEFDMEY